MSNQRQESVAKLRSLIANLLDYEIEKIDIHTTFLEMGSDSIALVEFMQKFEKVFGIKLSMRQLLGELVTIDALASYIEQNTCIEKKSNITSESSKFSELKNIQKSQVEVSNLPRQADKRFGETVSESLIEEIISQQMALMAKQLEVLRVCSEPVAGELVAGEPISSESLTQEKRPEIEVKEVEEYQPAVVPLTEPILVPLTEAQKQLWFLDKLEGNSKQAYVKFVCLQIEGKLHVEVIEQAIQKVVGRHEALRTRICADGNFQEVLPEVEFPVPLIDFSNSSTGEYQSSVDQWFSKALLEPFNLSQASLLKVYILKLEEEIHQLVFKMHHIVLDGVSMGIILQEIAALYDAGCQGNIPQLQPARQFREYIESHHKKSQTEEMKNHESYWLEKFSNSIPTLNLPTDRSRPSIMSYAGRRVSLKFDTQFCSQIRKVSQAEGCTIFTLLLAIYKLLLHKLSGDEDIAVGIATTGRNSQESKNLVGYCTHLLPIRTSLVSTSSESEGSLSISKFLGQMRGSLLDDFEHQEYPFAQLLKNLNLKIDPSRPALVSALFNINRNQKTQLLGLKTSFIPIPNSFVPYDLFLEITETKDELFLDLDYNSDLFDDTTIKRWLGHYQNLLSSIVENTQQAIAELPLLSEAEQYQLLVEWNDTENKYPRDKFIHQLFEEQVEKTPNAIAVVFEDEQLNYQQLNQRANQLAYHLQSLGVKPEVLVGICVERSVEMVVGLLGILKAGGAYVPLDPNYPQERIDYILGDSGVEILLTQQELSSSLPQYQGQVVCLDSDWEQIRQQQEKNLDVAIFPDNLAYVIYTSGSTGKPKGVQIRHTGLVNFLNSMRTFPGCCQEDIFLAVTTICFDIAALEIYLPLIVGAKVIVASGAMAKDGEKLLRELESRKITLMQATPATWQMLLTNGWSSNYPLKVLCGGEALSKSLADEILETGSQLWNLYGPTETTIWSTISQVETIKTLAKTKDAVSSIGRPIANTQIYILNSHLQVLPIGVPGELYIGGDGLARGYLKRPSLTQEKFIHHPFKKEERLYKTGDLARYLPDGNIEYLGRIDNQVKIRGFRVELSEIESVLSAHSQIQQAVVIASGDSYENKRLVAYVVTNSLLANSSSLREYLGHKLPEYMIPSVFITLDTLPLTPNGKVDRKALPATDIELIRSHEYVPPQTQTEKHLAVILQEVLQLEKVSIDDNFFELGINSVSLMSINIKLRKKLFIELPIVDMFTYPNIKSLSRHIANKNKTESLQEIRLMNKGSIKSKREKMRKLRGKS